MLPVSSKPKRIAIADANNFYVSCERVFRPQWQNIPMGVLSNNDGCIVARSNELKAAGIPMGAPYFKIRDQLDSLGTVVVSSNYTLYGDMSSRVMTTFEQFTPDIEVYSIDEAWLDLTGFNTATLDAYAREIVSTTQRDTGIPISMGIGPTKTLAKIASHICKKRKIPGNIFNLGSGESLDKVLNEIPVEDIWGIGRRWSEKLHDMGIHTALNLRNCDRQAMRDRFSVVMVRIIDELRGEPCITTHSGTAKKQIIASRSFGERITDKNGLQQALARYASRAAEKLRAQNSVCRAIQISIRTGFFNKNEPPYNNSVIIRFPTPSSDTRALIAATSKGLDRIYKPGYRYAKAGVMLFDISPDEMKQLDLFNSAQSNRSDSLMNTLDALTDRFGAKAAFLGAQGTQQAWAMKRNRMTQAYTTSWSELTTVK